MDRYDIFFKSYQPQTFVRTFGVLYLHFIGFQLFLFQTYAFSLCRNNLLTKLNQPL